MELGIKGKVALVAAGSRGIGFATAQALADEGAIVSICSRDEKNLEVAQKQLGSMHRAYACDLGSREEIAHWVAATERDLGTPAILVTNTGGPPAGLVTELTDDQWIYGFEHTLLNITRLMELVVPKMKEVQWGRIVHITSLAAKDPEPILAISSTLRSGIGALCRLQAKALGADGITVNCVLPGHTETDRQTHLLELRAQKASRSLDEERAYSAASIPVKRLAAPEEIASVVAFLCSQKASYLSGASIVVDGAASHGLG